MGVGGSHEYRVCHAIPSYAASGSDLLLLGESQESAKAHWVGEPGIRFPKYWRCSIKGKKWDALGRHFWHFLPRSNIYDLGRPIEDLSLNWCYLRGQAGGKYLASLWLKLQNRQKMRFLCRSTLSHRQHRQPIGSAHFWSYASLSPSQASPYISINFF